MIGQVRHHGPIQLPGPLQGCDQPSDLVVHLAGLRQVPRVVLAHLGRVPQVRWQAVGDIVGRILESAMAAKGTVGVVRAEVQAEWTVMALLQEGFRLLQIGLSGRKFVMEAVRQRASR